MSNMRIFLVFLALGGCVQAPGEPPSRQLDPMNVAARACGRFIETGALPVADLAAAGFVPAGDWFLFPPEKGLPVLVSTNMRGRCFINAKPRGRIKSQIIILDALESDGWERESGLTMQKGSKRLTRKEIQSASGNYLAEISAV